MKPLVSILIPAFNAAPWIADTIQSALGQTWPHKEIIVVNDGSTDHTLALACQFVPDGVRIVTQPNQGAAAARNKAFALSRGEYIQWLDADDLLAPDKIARQMEVLDTCRSPRTLLSAAWGAFFYRCERARFTPTALWRDLAPLEWLVAYCERNDWMQPATWLVSRELTLAAGPWDTRLLSDDDGEYFCRVILASDGIRFIPEARVWYRRRLDSLSHIGRSHRKLEAHFLSMRLNIAHLRSCEDSERVRAACLRYLQRYLIYFYPERPDIVQQAEQLASTLGGHLQVPRLAWKYAWIQKVLGWPAAKHTQRVYNRWKLAWRIAWDQALYRLEHRPMRQPESVVHT